MNKALLVVGSVAFDTLKTRAGERTDILGGAATYIALCASHFAPVNLVAVVGKGDFPDEHVQLLTGRGVNLDGLEMAQGRTFRWSGVYADDFSTRQTLKTELGVFADFDPKIPPHYRSPSFVLLGNIHPAVQEKTLDRIGGAPFVITDTMNLWIDVAADELKRVIARTHLLVINDEEAQQLTGEKQIRNAAKKVLAMGLRAVIIKRGEHGAFLFTGDDVFFCPAIPLEEVIDPTGAGDSFVGGLAGYLVSQDRTDAPALRRAMRCGTAVASVTCEGFGTTATAALTKTRIDERIAFLEKLVRLD